MRQPLVSIVVPLFNAADYIDECVTSLVNQTYKNLEIFLIDDGSTDNSRNKCERLAEIDSRITVIHCINGGPAKARNIGLEHSTGEFLLFVDSDDSLQLTAVSRLVSLATEKHADLVCFDFSAKCQNPRMSRDSLLPEAFPEVSSSSGIDCLKYIFQGRLGNYSWAFLYRRQFLTKQSNRFPTDIRLLEDAVFLNKLLPRANEVVYCPKKLYTYNIRENNSLGQIKDTQKAKEAYKAVLTIKKFSIENKLYYDFCPLEVDLLIYVFNQAEAGTDETTLNFLHSVRSELLTIIDYGVFQRLRRKRKIQVLLFQFNLYDLFIHHRIRFC